MQIIKHYIILLKVIIFSENNISAPNINERAMFGRFVTFHKVHGVISCKTIVLRFKLRI